MVPRLLRGDETWCQGFSEPGTGQQPRLARRAGPTRTDDGWRVTGQKVWTSLAQYAQRCVLLTRTGTAGVGPPRASPRCSSTWTRPGITVRPIETMHGAPEFCEVFFDDVARAVRPHARRRGPGLVGGHGPAAVRAQHALWHRGAFLHRRLQQLLDAAPAGRARSRRALGEVTQLLYAFRARSRATQHRLARGEQLGPETSIDKVLLATAEQAVFDLVADGLAAEVTIGDDPDERRWRTEFLYSRAATIYGGSAEIQRNIIARRLLDLGNDR